MIIPKVPHRWSVTGQLPKAPFDRIPEEDLDVLDEDLLQIVDSSRQYTLDVGWYPAGSRDGRFICRVVYGDRWDRPVEKMETKSSEGTRQWLKQALEKVRLLVGQEGQFSTRVGVFFYVGRARRATAREKPSRVDQYIAPHFVAPNADTKSRSTPRPQLFLPTTNTVRPYQPAHAA
jgi:hypothetical protein